MTSSSRDTNKFVIMTALAAVLICLLVYLRALGCDFVNLDDPQYVQLNTAIRHMDGNFLAWAFTNQAVGWWMPLTWISFAIDYHFWQLNPLGYHLTNILLHAANTGLVVLIADRLYRKTLPETSIAAEPAYLYPAMLLLAGLLFGIHPLRVESVAWVTERKDVLNGVFSLGSILCYLHYVQKKEAAEKKGATRDYLLSLAVFSCSLMAKQVSVVLPVMLLVADWYPLGRLRKGNILPVLVEKLPFLLLSAAMAISTIIIAKLGGSLDTSLSFVERLIISGNALFEYCRLLLYPIGILPLHIIPDPIPPAFTVKAIISALACVCIYLGRRKTWLLATWLCFLVPLLPILGFFQNGAQAFAARFTYLPSVAPSITAAALIALAYHKTLEKPQRKPRLCILVVAMITALFLFYIVLTQRLIDVWKDSGAHWSRIIAHQPFERAYFFRGVYYVDARRYQEAIDDYTACITIATRERMPDIFNLYAYRGEALYLAGRFNESVQDLNIAISMFPNPLYYFHRGRALKALGRMNEAEADLKRAGSKSGVIEWFSREEDTFR